MQYILIEPTPDQRWICCNGDEKDRENCLKNGGRVLPQEEVDKIFGNLAFIASPKNTYVSDDGYTIVFIPPPHNECINEKSRIIESQRDDLLNECDLFLSVIRWKNMDSYQKKLWSEYRQSLVDYTNLDGFPWLNQTPPPWPEKPEKDATPDNIEDLRNLRLHELNEIFNEWIDSPHSSILSSTGFAVNANSVSKKNIDGLIFAMEATGADSVTFMCFDNTPAQLTLQQLRKIQLELIQYGSALYTRKWYYRSKIENAQTKEELNSIKFDFSDVDIPK